MLLILSGKSIEEIKMDAARERNKELAEFLKATGERNDASASSATSLSPGSQIQSKSSTSVLDMSSSRGVSKQQGSKNSPNGTPSDLQSSNLTNGTPASLDEFMYGFPSDGLSTASNKWWGGSSALDGKHDFHGVQGADIQAEEHQSKEKSVSAESSLLGKSDSRMDHSDVGPQGTGILTAVRKRALDEGRALKLGVYRYGGMKKLGRRERVLLRGIFKSSLPSECDTWF